MAEASEIQSATDDDQSDVDALCVRTLFERIPLANALSPLGTLFLGWFEKDYVSLSTLVGWMILISLFQAVTFWNTKRFLRHPPLKERLRDWRYWQIVWTGLEGMCWGSAAILFHASGSSGSFNDVVVLMVIITVVCLSIFPLAPSYPTFASFISGALLVPVAHYFWVGDMHNAPYIVGILTLMLALLKLGRVANQEFVEGASRLVLIQKISKQLEQRNQQLDELNRQLSVVAIHDKLTGLYNRHFIVDQLERQYESYVRHGNACSIVMVDIDHFKQINDRYGHFVGDEVLVAFSRLMESMVRQGDLIGRYGGEEFLLVLPMTDLAAATQLAQRICTSLKAGPLVDQPVMLVVTASFGVAQIRSGETIDDWLVRVDRAMYRAKESGRNRVMG
ncbi:MAG: GGDEF domain-containing protein [Sideroxyarcus sp.]